MNVPVTTALKPSGFQQLVETLSGDFFHEDEINVCRLIDTSRVNARAGATGEYGLDSTAGENAAYNGHHILQPGIGVKFQRGLPASRGRRRKAPTLSDKVRSARASFVRYASSSFLAK